MGIADYRGLGDDTTFVGPTQDQKASWAAWSPEWNQTSVLRRSGTQAVVILFPEHGIDS